VRGSEDDPLNIALAVGTVLSACARQPDCARTYPDVLPRFQAAVTTWASTDGFRAGLKHYDMAAISRFLGMTLYDPEGVANLPSDLTSLMAGDHAMLDWVLDQPDPVAEGVMLAHYCTDMLPFESLDQMKAKAGTDTIARALASGVTDLLEGCDGWAATRAPQASILPVRSNLPVLLLSAGIDPGTPSAYAAKAAETLPNAQSVVFPVRSHGVLSWSACARAIMGQFLAAPVTPVDRACLSVEQGPIRFTTQQTHEAIP
jgi:pimeloyl-ACP methyl ester carboxylesterase